MKPRLLDLFCKAGGAAAGYAAAGFEVVGVDIEPQPRYPFRFIRADALTVDLSGFDAYHASPPCQRFTEVNNQYRSRMDHPDLIEPIRRRLVDTGKPWIIENVPRAPLISAVVLCGLSFGKKWFKHRCFESNVFLMTPPHITHTGKNRHTGYYNMVGKKGHSRAGFKHVFGCSWMTETETRNAVPPVYTEFLGQQLYAYITGEPAWYPAKVR